MNYLKVISLLFFSGSFFTSQAQQISDFRYFDTLSIEFRGIQSPETYYSDISDKGNIAGYYKLNSNMVGFIKLNTGEVLSYKHLGYSNTEITGINDNGHFTGRAYNGTIDAIAIKGEYTIDSIGFKNVTRTSFNSISGPNKMPLKLNNNDIIIGNVKSGTYRWLNYEDAFGSSGIMGLKRFQKGATIFNTFGQGGNDKLQFVGYLQDGIERKPFIYKHAISQFTLLTHKNSSMANKSTLLNDINNDGFVVLRYRDNKGVFQGAWGKITGNVINYGGSIPVLNTKYGSSIQGINNNGDIVGWFKPSPNRVVAFVAKRQPYFVKDFNVTIHGLDFENSKFVFEYPQGKYDYVNKDPFTGFSQSIIRTLTDFNTHLHVADSNSLVSGLVSPSWKSFVMSGGEELSYIGQNIRIGALYKWLNMSDTAFSGWCYGMATMVGQHISNPSVIYNRFPQFPQELSANNYKHLTMPFDVDEALGAMQLYQYSIRLVRENINYSSCLDLMYKIENGDIQAKGDLAKLIKKNISIMAEAMAGEPKKGTYHTMAIYILYSDGAQGGHEVFPFLVARPLEQNQGFDTIYIYDPNYPNETIKIVCDYENNKYVAINEFNTELYTVKAIGRSGSLAKKNIIKNAVFGTNQIIKHNGKKNKFELENNELYVNNICNFSIKNMDNPSQKFEFINGKQTNNFKGISMLLIQDSDKSPDILRMDKSINAECKLLGCNKGYSFSYQFDNGLVSVGRNKSNSSDEDIVIIKPNELTISNPDVKDKEFTISAIFMDNEKETVVKLSNYKLAQNQEVRIKIQDENSFKVYNDESKAVSYNLNARYLKKDDYYTWETKQIEIAPTTNHTIVFRPKNNEAKVKILVDTLQDGTIDDTLNIKNGTNYTINFKQYFDLQIFPNPSKGIFQLKINNIHYRELKLVVINALGQPVLVQKVKPGIKVSELIDLSEKLSGLYFLQLFENDYLLYAQPIQLIR